MVHDPVPGNPIGTRARMIKVDSTSRLRGSGMINAANLVNDGLVSQSQRDHVKLREVAEYFIAHVTGPRRESR